MPLRRLALLAILVFYVPIALYVYGVVGHHPFLRFGLAAGLVLPLVAYRLSVAEGPTKPDASWLAGPGPLLTVLSLHALVFAVFQPHWHAGQAVVDEATYLFQADALRHGALSTSSPVVADATDANAPMTRAFSHTHSIHQGGAWFGKYPPGWPVLLAVGQWLGIASMASPVLGLAYLCLTYLVALEFDCGEDRRLTALIAVALMAASPFVYFNQLGYLSHALCSVLVAGVCLAALRFQRTGATAHLAWAFVGIPLAITVRPLTGALLGVVAALYLLAVGRDAAERWRVFGAAAASVCGAAALYVGYNLATTGAALLHPYSLYTRLQNALYGQALQVGAVPAELQWNLDTVWALFINVRVSLFAAEILLLGPILIPCFLYAVRIATSRCRAVLLPIALAVTVVVAHAFTTMSSGSLWGERFHSEVAGSFFLAAAIGAAPWLARLSRTSLITLWLVWIVLQAPNFYAYFHYIEPTARFVRNLREASQRHPASPRNPDIVFTTEVAQPVRGFIPQHWNDNPWDWRSAERLFLVDPGSPAARKTVAETLGRSRWFVFSIDPSGTKVEVRESFSDAEASR